MNYKNIFLATLVAVPLTVLEVSAAGNSDKLKDTIIDKTIQRFEDGFNSLFTNTELTIEGRTGSDPNFTLLTVNPITEDEAEGNLTFFQGSIIRQIIEIRLILELGIDNLVMIKNGFMESMPFMIMKTLMNIQDGVLVLS